MSVTFKYLPILDHAGREGESHWAAYAAECANQQGRFWEYHDKLFAEWRGENVGTYTLENLKQYAVELHLDSTRFNLCLENGDARAAVDQDIAEAQGKGVRGTPAFYVNGQPFFPRGLDFAAFSSPLNDRLVVDTPPPK